MLCVCHSLGGLVLKQALCIANEQLYRHESLINSVSGIIFLSTPHLASNQKETIERMSMILRLTGKRFGKAAARTPDENGALLSNLSKRFEGIYFRTPILSVYEVKETRISENPFTSKSIVVGTHE